MNGKRHGSAAAALRWTAGALCAIACACSGTPVAVSAAYRREVLTRVAHSSADLASDPSATDHGWRPNESIDFRYRPQKSEVENPWRSTVAMTAVAGTYSGMALWAYFAWYAGQTKDDFRFARERWFGATTYAGGADKLGHAYANYVMTRVAAQELQWGGYSAGFAAAASSLLTLGFFVGVEVKDGYHKGFGFSRGDMLADVVGIGLANLLLWSPRIDELFDFRINYFPSALFAERLLQGDVDVGEDYSGMDFGVWLHLGSLESVRRRDRLWAARFVDVGVGYATRGFLPLPDDPAVLRERQLYLGVTANLAALLDAWLFDYGHREGHGRRLVRGFAEFVTLPFTTWKLGPVLTSPQFPETVP